MALDTVFNREMLENKKSIMFKKNNINEKINEFEERYNELIQKNNSYRLPKKYDWDFISKQYSEVFQNFTNCQNK